MKKNSFRFITGLTLLVAVTTTVKAQNIGINISGANPSVNAILDLNTGNSNNLGLIIPNVSLTALGTFNPPIANAATAGDVGMMVYNTNAAVGSGIGYYYWNGATWVSVSGAGATVTAANDGTSLNGTTVIFGNAFGGTTGELTQNTEVPFNGNNLTFSTVGGSGNIGIDLAASTSAAQALEIGGVANTARIDGLGSAGTTYNQVTANKGDLVFANDANGDLWSLKAPSVASVLVSSATGVLSWQNGTVPTGSGTINYLARWTPSATQLGVGITQDNGARVSVTTAVSAFPVGNIFTATGNATDVNGILGTTAQATGNGVQGTNTAGSGTTSGVYGSSTSATGFGVQGVDNVANGIGVVGSNSATTGTSEGVEGYIGAVVAPTNPSGVYGSEAVNTAGTSGVRGVSTATSAAAYGVYGSSTSSGGYGVYGSNSNLDGIGVYGINNAAHASGLPGFGVYGQTDQEGFVENSSIAGVQEGTTYYNNSIEGLGDYPFYSTFNYAPTYGSGVFGVGLAQGVYGYAPNPFAFGGAGVTGIASGGALNVLVQTGQSYGVLGEMGAIGAGIAGYANGVGTFPAAVTTAGSMGVANGTGTTIGAVGVNINANGVGSAGLGNDMAAFVIPGTGAGAANTGNTIGEVGYAKSAGAGVGVVGVGNNIGVATVPAVGAGAAFIGVDEGSISYANSSGVGVGAIGVGNDLLASTVPAAGSGGAFDGTGIGSFSYASTVGTGTGVVGNGNGVGAITVLGNGSGGAFSGTSYGLYAKSTSAVNPSGAIECSNTETGNTVYVDYFNGTNYKILGTTPGTVSCSVLNSKGQSVVMHAPETPEAYYEDYGQGKLVAGRVHIDMDPDFAKNICVNEKHPLRVFIQLEGDCKGVYVTNKTATGFDVIELDGGTSNISFQYHIIGNQADAVMPSGVVSKFADLRFEPTPKADNTITIQTQNTAGTTISSIEKTAEKPNVPAIETPEPGHAAKIPAEMIQKLKDQSGSTTQKQ